MSGEGQQSLISSKLILPIGVTLLIPLALINTSESLNPFWGTSAPVNLILFVAGIVSITAGLILLYQTIKLFARVGKGTLAPWDAPKTLVIVGIYRYVRNPMHSGIFFILFGETLISGHPLIFAWWIIFIVVHLFYIPLSEEPGLKERFGESYRIYCENVPRWIPRRSTWQAQNIA